jgi:hypothetical protein
LGWLLVRLAAEGGVPAGWTALMAPGALAVALLSLLLAWLMRRR